MTMEGTRRLYFEDAYLAEFDAEVMERTERDGRPAVVLDRTAFYPESGGQPWDTGKLGGAAVLEVLDLDGVILHVLDKAIEAGPVPGRVDWPGRFDRMQQHTGQHILSQAFWEVLKGETRSFHLGPEVSTLEIGLGAVAEAELDKVEDRANTVVWEDREVKTYFVPEERIDEVPLRRPPKKQGLLRVVEVDGFDYSACGGTHVRRTGEIGGIKIVGAEKIRGNLRFDFLCGGRALRDYREKDRSARKLAGTFSCGRPGSPPRLRSWGPSTRLSRSGPGSSRSDWPPSKPGRSSARLPDGSSRASSTTGPPTRPASWPSTSSGAASTRWPTARSAKARPISSRPGPTPSKRI
jgi:alanyl-tRNA synthetase